MEWDIYFFFFFFVGVSVMVMYDVISFLFGRCLLCIFVYIIVYMLTYKPFS